MPPQKMTPLHYAARNGQLEVVRALLDRGAAVDAKEVSGLGGAGRGPVLGWLESAARAVTLAGVGAAS
jgi:hypothetical protein